MFALDVLVVHDQTCEERPYHDLMRDYRAVGLPVYADHCPKCGRWAHILQGDPGPKFWQITDCAKCGLYKVTGRKYDGTRTVTHLTKEQETPCQISQRASE